MPRTNTLLACGIGADIVSVDLSTALPFHQVCLAPPRTHHPMQLYQQLYKHTSKPILTCHAPLTLAQSGNQTPVVMAFDGQNAYQSK